TGLSWSSWRFFSWRTRLSWASSRRPWLSISRLKPCLVPTVRCHLQCCWPWYTRRACLWYVKQKWCQWWFSRADQKLMCISMQSFGHSWSFMASSMQMASSVNCSQVRSLCEMTTALSLVIEEAMKEWLPSGPCMSVMEELLKVNKPEFSASARPSFMKYHNAQKSVHLSFHMATWARSTRGSDGTATFQMGTNFTLFFLHSSQRIWASSSAPLSASSAACASSANLAVHHCLCRCCKPKHW
ncbi:hypothetical protein PAXRUDRAFT_799924, partial [Paxillus rubicundulus Ve08.2h10]